MKASTKRNRWSGVLLLALLISFTPALAQDPPPPVEVDVGISGTTAPSRTVTATAMVTVNDGSTIMSYAWMQTYGVPVTVLSGADTDTFTFRLGTGWDYRADLIHKLSEPAVGAGELPPNVPFPEGEFPGGLQDRYQVVGINPFAIEEAALVIVEVWVTTTSGVHHGEGEIHTALPFKPSSGLRNVPIGVPVLLKGKAQNGYDWTLTAPGGSGATLYGGGSSSPYFTPDVEGMYVATVTDRATMTPVDLEIYAGEFRGVIAGEDGDGRPVGDPVCTSCHSGVIAPDLFTPWAETGHAEIFTDNINFGGHYSTNCLGCHTVGYDPGVDNGGIDDASDWQAFLDADYFHQTGPDIWSTILAEQPDTAQRANIQCENCHGPQITGAHALGEGGDYPRASISSDVCAVCHGEPLRHARFQQWQLSGHANYEVAIDESGSGNCSRCHTGNGFLKWLPILLDDDPATDPTASIAVDWTADEAHPQTCVVCHDPHAIGTTTGSDTNATIYIQGDTPPLIAGYQVIGAGRGAICMTCHNSRRGLRNDATFDGLGDPDRAPHGSSQTDVLMGENAFGVNVGVRGSHSFVTDTCVTCHMVATPPPDALAYNQGGTNHTFFAGPGICSECHGEVLTAEVVENVVDAIMDDVKGLVEGAYVDLIAGLIDAGNTIDLNGAAEITSAANIEALGFGEYHGRQAISVTMGGTTYGPFRIGDVDVVGPGGTVALPDVSPDELLKAGWNYNLIHNDGSHGVHNPTYAIRVLDAARDFITGGGGGGPRVIADLFAGM